MAKKSFYKILTDDELFALLKNDKNAENEFYKRYKVKVKSFLRHYKLNALEREDLIQEGMIGLFHAIETFDKRKGFKFSTYSNTCIRNRIYNALDSLWQHKKKIDNERDIEEIVSNSDPENSSIQTELSENLESAVSKLNDLEQKVLDRYLDNKSYKDIAGELEISSKKVDNILMKVKSKLAKFLNEI